MPWNSIWPDGASSVSANEIPGQQNTTYIETTMGNSVVGTNTTSTRDHFWDVGSNEDGRHRFIQSPAFTVGGVPTDPVIGTGMDTVRYAKTTNGRVEWFVRNVNGIYQDVPSVLTGTIAIPSTSTFTNIVAVPANVYGDITMYYVLAGVAVTQKGYFVSTATTCAANAVVILAESGSTFSSLIFANTVASISGLNIRARRGGSGTLSTTWTYIITYRAL